MVHSELVAVQTTMGGGDGTRAGIWDSKVYLVLQPDLYGKAEMTSLDGHDYAVLVEGATTNFPQEKQQGLLRVGSIPVEPCLQRSYSNSSDKEFVNEMCCLLSATKDTVAIRPSGPQPPQPRQTCTLRGLGMGKN